MDHVARKIEHIQSQDGGLARRSSRAKPDGASPLHPGFQNRTSTSLGAPPTGAPPDASSPNVTDPSRQGKSFDIPKVTFGHKSDPQRAVYDPGLAECMMNEAKRSPDDFAQNLHALLPRTVTED
jgi:hypothetical protein